MNLIAEISLAGKVLLTAVVASTSFSPSGLGYGGSITIERTDDVANADDLYVGMPIRIAGLDAGCVHDYDAETLLITFGYCVSGTAMTASGNVTSNLDTVDATDMPIGTTATSTTVTVDGTTSTNVITADELFSVIERRSVGEHRARCVMIANGTPMRHHRESREMTEDERAAERARYCAPFESIMAPPTSSIEAQSVSIGTVASNLDTQLTTGTITYTVYATPPPTLIERLRAWLAGWWAE